MCAQYLAILIYRPSTIIGTILLTANKTNGFLLHLAIQVVILPPIIPNIRNIFIKYDSSKKYVSSL